MNRAAGNFLFLFVLALALLFSPVPQAAFGDAAEAAEAPAVLAWVNRLRAQRGLSKLGTDPLLEKTAAAYVVDLAERGILSHVDKQGRRALQRFRAYGGTTVLVGEILGSAATLRPVTAAWQASAEHLEVVLNPLWTHCGAATAQRAGSNPVWVVLFTRHRIDPLEILRCPEGYLIRGRLTDLRALEPILLSGIETIDPLHWDSRKGEFSFLVPPDRGQIYHRLGYRSRDGGLVVANTFYPLEALTSEVVTSDREKESR